MRGKSLLDASVANQFSFFLSFLVPHFSYILSLFISGYISSVVVDGRDGSVGFVEVCLLLSENLPRREELTPNPGSSRPWDDSAQSWNLVGHAVSRTFPSFSPLSFAQTFAAEPFPLSSPRSERDTILDLTSRHSTSIRKLQRLLSWIENDWRGLTVRAAPCSSHSTRAS